jgi:hypothetical protein
MDGNFQFLNFVLIPIMFCFYEIVVCFGNDKMNLL